MQKFRKKPVVIEAVQMPNGPGLQIKERQAVVDWCDENRGGRTIRYTTAGMFIETLEGEMKVSDGDWIIKGIAGELYPCKPEIFEATYEGAED